MAKFPDLAAISAGAGTPGAARAGKAFSLADGRPGQRVSRLRGATAVGRVFGALAARLLTA